LMRIFVTGQHGQLARCLAEANMLHKHELVFGARPSFDMSQASSIADAISSARPDLVVNAAAYTAVDKAESEPDVAFAINRDGARIVAETAGHLGVPVIHVSTDYVFDGKSQNAYVESDVTGPTGVYGQSKLEGELAVQSATERHVILRTAWVYSVYGANFVNTMLRAGQARPELRVVDDQIGNPTSAHDLAKAIFGIADSLREGNAHFGLFHAAGRGDVTWYGFAAAIFEVAQESGMIAPQLTAIPTSEYPTPAKRPANSRLNCTKLEKQYGIVLPEWRASIGECVRVLLQEMKTGP
jgi:dTDP-4-dehydrorhamnose reductase